MMSHHLLMKVIIIRGILVRMHIVCERDLLFDFDDYVRIQENTHIVCISKRKQGDKNIVASSITKPKSIPSRMCLAPHGCG